MSNIRRTIARNREHIFTPKAIAAWRKQAERICPRTPSLSVAGRYEVKRTRKQKAAELAEILKDRDDYRADYAMAYATDSRHMIDVVESVLRVERDGTIVTSIFPGIGWEPKYKRPTEAEENAAFEREQFPETATLTEQEVADFILADFVEVDSYADFPEAERPFVKAFVEGDGNPKTPRGIFSEAV